MGEDINRESKGKELMDSGLEGISGLKVVLIGDGGAYISESCDRLSGDVKAENRCRMLSHCVCVVCRQELRATRMGEGECGPVELWRLRNVSTKKNVSATETHSLSSLSKNTIESWTTESHASLAATRSSRALRDCEIYCEM